MTSSVNDWNALPEADAMSELGQCCGSRAWARQMIERRPFRDLRHLLQAADEVWRSLTEEDWLEAFDHHPRIGEREAAVRQDARAAAWSAAEQAVASDAGAAMAARIADGNRAYEARFGFIFLICAAGRSAQEIHDALERRLSNPRPAELRVAAEEQRKITRLRLEKLFGAESTVSR